VRSGGKRCGLSKVRHFSGVRYSVTGYVITKLKEITSLKLKGLNSIKKQQTALNT
jgi:hypothetical protein